MGSDLVLLHFDGHAVGIAANNGTVVVITLVPLMHEGEVSCA